MSLPSKFTDIQHNISKYHERGLTLCQQEVIRNANIKRTVLLLSPHINAKNIDCHGSTKDWHPWDVKVVSRGINCLHVVWAFQGLQPDFHSMDGWRAIPVFQFPFHLYFQLDLQAASGPRSYCFHVHHNRPRKTRGEAELCWSLVFVADRHHNYGQLIICFFLLHLWLKSVSQLPLLLEGRKLF